MSRFTNLPALARSAVIALALGGATLVGTTTAQAAPPAPHFSMQFGFGNGGFWYGHGRDHNRYCLTDHQVRRLLQRHGYDHIRFYDRRGRIVGVRAEKHNRDYIVRVDSCNGRIVSAERIRHR